MRRGAEPQNSALGDLDAPGLEQLLLDPSAFGRVLLGYDLWGAQVEILRALAKCPRVAVKACHASGKTTTAAIAVLWWISRFRDAIAVTTAPTWTQVERLLWGEIHRAVRRSVVPFPIPNQTELRLGPGNYAIGLSTNEGVRFQGFHGRVLIVLDEAPGVKPEIWEAIEGIRAGGDVRVLALGNPVVASGPFYDAFTTNREGWSTFTISAFNSPNLSGVTMDDLDQMQPEELDVAERPYLVSRRWVQEKWREWGPANPLWQARVLGEFPIQAEDALVPLAWLEAARSRHLEPDAEAQWCAGVDVAGPGEDETVLVVRHGPQIVETRAWPQQDPRGEVVAALKTYADRDLRVYVDAVGIGYYLARHLEDAGFSVRDVNVGKAAKDPEKYANRKAELYWGLRQRIQDGDLTDLTDERTIAQLAAIRYHHNARGQIVIESKEELRKRGVKSPDRAEAVMLAFITKRPFRLEDHIIFI